MRGRPFGLQWVEACVRIGLPADQCLVTRARLTVREVVDQLELDAHGATERNIFDDDVLADARESLSESNLEHYLGVDLVCSLTVRHVQQVVRRERNFPLHEDDVCTGCS